MTNMLLQKPTDLDLLCLQRQGISGFSRTRVNIFLFLPQKCIRIVGTQENRLEFLMSGEELLMIILSI